MKNHSKNASVTERTHRPWEFQAYKPIHYLVSLDLSMYSNSQTSATNFYPSNLFFLRER